MKSRLAMFCVGVLLSIFAAEENACAQLGRQQQMTQNRYARHIQHHWQQPRQSVVPPTNRRVVQPNFGHQQLRNQQTALQPQNRLAYESNRFRQFQRRLDPLYTPPKPTLPNLRWDSRDYGIETPMIFKNMAKSFGW